MFLTFTFWFATPLSIKLKKQLFNYINKSSIKHFTQLCTKMTFLYGIASFIFSTWKYCTCDRSTVFILYNQTLFKEEFLPFLTSCYNACFICDLTGTPALSSPPHTNSGTLVSRKSGFCSHHSPRTQMACIPPSEGGSTRAERTPNRPPLTSAPGSGQLLELYKTG